MSARSGWSFMAAERTLRISEPLGLISQCRLQSPSIRIFLVTISSSKEGERMKTAAMKCVVAGGLGLVLAGISYALPSTWQQLTNSRSHLLRRQRRERANRLITDGYDIASIDIKNCTFDLMMVSKGEGLSLKFHGFNVKSIKTIDTTLAPGNYYKTPAEVEAFVKQIAQDHPSICAR